jgi:hypothetical protein
VADQRLPIHSYMPHKLVSDVRNGPLNREKASATAIEESVEDQGYTTNHEGMSPEDGKDTIDHLNHEKETTTWNGRR